MRTVASGGNQSLNSSTRFFLDWTLLASTLVFFSSECADGNSHAHTDLPVLLAGRLGGAIRPGRHLRREEPIANLYTSILNAVGVANSKFGDDGTGALPGLG